MRVNQTGINQAQANETAAAKQAAKAKAAQAKDGKEKAPASTGLLADSARPEISEKGKEFARVKAAASNAPEIREEKIAELKKRIMEGKYQVDANKIADRMVDEHIQMSGIG